MSGKFIAIEGMDGCGKDVHAKRLAERLEAEGHTVMHTCEPSTGPIGELLRRMLRGEVDIGRTAAAPLFAADRLDHVQRGITPALEQGAVVVCNRYELSNLVYRAAEAPGPLFLCGRARCWEGDDIAYLNGTLTCPTCGKPAYFKSDVLDRIDWAEGLTLGIPVPDLTLVLLVDAEESARRRAKRGQPSETYEVPLLQRRVATLYRCARRLTSAPVQYVDASGTKDETAERVWAAVEPVVRAERDNVAA